jgi:hypothetical protein
MWTAAAMAFFLILTMVQVHANKREASRLSDLIDKNRNHASRARDTIWEDRANLKLCLHQQIGENHRYASGERDRLLELCKENKIDIKACYDANSARIDDLEQDRAIIEAIDKLRFEKQKKIRDAVLGDKS